MTMRFTKEIYNIDKRKESYDNEEPKSPILGTAKRRGSVDNGLASEGESSPQKEVITRITSTLINNFEMNFEWNKESG